MSKNKSNKTKNSKACFTKGLISFYGGFNRNGKFI